MPFALIFIGMLLVISGFQDTYQQLGQQVQKDFTGSGNFIYWIISIGLLGSLGYVDELKTFSRASMALVIVVMFLSNKGIFSQFNSAVQTGDTASVNPIGTPLPAMASASGGGGGSGGGSGGGPLGILQSIGSLFGG